MREERGQLAGDITISEPYTLWGTIAGKVTASKGAKFYLRGTIHGNLIIENGGRCHILGSVNGSVTVLPGSKLIHDGLIAGDLVNHGGRMYVQPGSIVRGRVQTIDGRSDVSRSAVTGGG